jgi:hypothetical protein
MEIAQEVFRQQLFQSPGLAVAAPSNGTQRYLSHFSRRVARLAAALKSKTVLLSA